ncbi:hypothetical protein [Actinoplanes sp. NBRC 101535]|uniref:LppU/SCO3897 family protein n=1 Tax=Actinoplanes sp. NBRC 101535 TaxID=3032196 RepID=UPI0024A2F020|nr:hypothetical protein [Actinoplanes sp. NBRC 101535]GLY08522.1 hypothetical protein Acsp01_89010 [Actinoplanes sp. NBRC 101535]
MSQNGPHSGQSWPGKSPEEPYAEPADPWVGQPHQIPHQPYTPVPPPPDWNAPQPPPRRGFAMGALVAVLSVLAGGGIATTVWFLLGRDDETPAPLAVPTTAAAGGPRPQTSEDARFAEKGQCVRNEGTNNEPELRIVVCAANTYEVLKRIDGSANGEKDAMGKCAKVTGYTKWYYYDTEYDDVDFVLCLKEF